MHMWLAGLGLALLCTVSADECVKDFSKINGKWCMTAFGSTCEHFLKHHNNAQQIMSEITTTEENKVKIITDFPLKNGCKKIELDFEKKEDGKYHHKSDRGEKEIEIVSTDCETYALIKKKMQKKEKATTLYALFTKECQLPDNLKEMFLEHGRSLKLKDNQMVFPTEEPCQIEG